MMDLLYSNLEYKSVKDVPPGDFVKQFGNDINNESYGVNQLQWRFDGDKLASTYYGKDVTWDSLDENEKNDVRADFRKKMRNDGLNKCNAETPENQKLIRKLSKSNTEFDKIFIIA